MRTPLETDYPDIANVIPAPVISWRLPQARLAPLKAWLKLAAHPATLRRALRTALIVGTTLIAINHGAAILTGTVTHGRVFQMCLTVVVPYLVSTTASVATRREMAARPPS